MIDILSSIFAKELALPLSESLKAGFPSPAADYTRQSLDFNRDLIRHPEATFYARVSGDSMIEAGINDGDIAVIDRSLDAAQGDLVVAFVDGEFTMKQIDFSHREEGYILLHPANPNYKDIRIEGDETFEVWGVVIWTIRSWRK